MSGQVFTGEVKEITRVQDLPEKKYKVTIDLCEIMDVSVKTNQDVSDFKIGDKVLIQCDEDFNNAIIVKK
jgi:hypothetical protein